MLGRAGIDDGRGGGNAGSYAEVVVEALGEGEIDLARTGELGLEGNTILKSVLEHKALAEGVKVQIHNELGSQMSLRGQLLVQFGVDLLVLVLSVFEGESEVLGRSQVGSKVEIGKSILRSRVGSISSNRQSFAVVEHKAIVDGEVLGIATEVGLAEEALS